MTPDTVLKTDKCTIAVEAAPEGKIRVLTTAWAQPVVILADQVLEVRIREGQVHILRKRGSWTTRTGSSGRRTPPISVTTSKPEFSR